MNCIKLHTLEGVSDSSILSPSNTNRIAPCERPCVPSGYTSSKDKIKNDSPVFRSMLSSAFSMVYSF